MGKENLEEAQEIIKDLVYLVNIALNYEFDVFGVYMNGAYDTLNDAENFLEKKRQLKTLKNDL